MEKKSLKECEKKKKTGEIRRSGKESKVGKKRTGVKQMREWDGRRRNVKSWIRGK